MWRGNEGDRTRLLCENKTQSTKTIETNEEV